MRLVRVFLSSPGDCHAEREATHGVVARLNADPVVASFARVEVVAWDWGVGVPLDALASPQMSVNRHLLVPEDCEVFVGIFRCRFGTPLPTNEFRREDGSPYNSGSEYEFDRAWQARRRGLSTPEVLMYRLDASATQMCPPGEQLTLLNTFFHSQPFKEENRWTGSVNRFKDTADFSASLDGHLRRVLSQWHPSHKLPLADWLGRHARRVIHDAGPRYTREVHVESEVTQIFDWLLARPKAIQTLDALLSEIWKNLDGQTFASFKDSLALVATGLREDPQWHVPPDFVTLANDLERLSQAAWKLDDEGIPGEASAAKTDQYRRHQIQQVAIKAREATQLLRGYAPFAGQRVMLLTGPAGQGKTHTLVHELQRVLAGGGIAVGALAQTLSGSNDLRSALMQIWRYEDHFDGFLDALENAAAQSGQRALIVIDALNETPNRTRWKNELNGIVREILERKHLTLAISVRSDYRQQVLPESASGSDPLWVERQHEGFAGIEPDALLAYCAHYGITAPVAPPIGELGNPLYVQLLVKSLQGRPIPSHWLPSWLEVWSTWIERLEADARARFALDQSRNHPVRRILSKLAASMITAGTFHLSRVKADEIARATAGMDGLVGFLCSAGALIDRIEGDDDIIEFGFERLSDTFFADRILDRLFTGKSDALQRRDALVAAFSSNGELHALAVVGGKGPLGYRRTGLLEALCLAVPVHTGVELPLLLPFKTSDAGEWSLPDWELREAFTDSLRWRSRSDEFGCTPKLLWRMYRRHGAQPDTAAGLDELIRLALIPGHPFAMTSLLHPLLQKKRSVGARDAVWSIKLVSLWHEGASNLTVLVRWAGESSLAGLHADIALPAAQLLAWMCTVSQQTLREHATRGLTRVLVSCPQIIEAVLSDFLVVNDDYVLESALIATLGVMIDGGHPECCTKAAGQVFQSIFGGDSPRCHLTIRHYARRIVEMASEKGWLKDVELTRVRPPYHSELPLDDVPSEKQLRVVDNSGGFGNIVGSALGRDFYWYVMGATSGAKPFSSHPLPHSSEPVRAYGDGNAESARVPPSGIFDIPMAARFVVWNCRRLGWTAERFELFDTGHQVRDGSRIARAGRTERIGKKYQWISWQTMLAFLADNYQMTPESLRGPRQYDTPHQIGYIDVIDPSRWLQLTAQPAVKSDDEKFWRIPSLPRWPAANDDDLDRWGSSQLFDLPAIDVINCVPDIPAQWGKGPWIRIAAENVWSSPAYPGVWGRDQERDADIWWQLTPALIRSRDLDTLMSELSKAEVCTQLAGIGRIDIESDSEIQLTEWPNVGESFNRGFETENESWHGPWLPVPWMPLVGKCGDPDRNDEHKEVILPWPRLFRDWGLKLDLQRGVVRLGDAGVFGLAGWVLGEEALFAQRDALLDLLDRNGNTLVWWMLGERRAFAREIGHSEPKKYIWIDSHGIAFLGKDGRTQVAWLRREVRD